jgi:hypothetical protein
LVELGVGVGDFPCTPVTGRAPTGALNSGEALGAVGSAWVAVYGHGNESLG